MTVNELIYKLSKLDVGDLQVHRSSEDYDSVAITEATIRTDDDDVTVVVID